MSVVSCLPLSGFILEKSLKKGFEDNHLLLVLFHFLIIDMTVF